MYIYYYYPSIYKDVLRGRKRGKTVNQPPRYDTGDNTNIQTYLLFTAINVFLGTKKLLLITARPSVLELFMFPFS